MYAKCYSTEYSEYKHNRDVHLSHTWQQRAPSSLAKSFVARAPWGELGVHRLLARQIEEVVFTRSLVRPSTTRSPSSAKKLIAESSQARALARSLLEVPPCCRP